MKRLLLPLLLALGVNACAPTATVQTPALPVRTAELAPAAELSLWQGDLTSKDRFQLEIRLTGAEEKIARSFAPTVSRNLERSRLLAYALFKELKDNDVPLEMAAIPLIESGLNPNVKAYRGAHGPWQYIRSTARSLGLKQTKSYDEVYDFVKVSEVSVKYLKKLHADLGNWELVAAAFNYGEYGVKKALARAVRQGKKVRGADDIALPRLTRAYVSRFRAFAALLRDPEKYRLSLPDIPNRPLFTKVKPVRGLKSLQEVARLTGTDLATLRLLNAGCRDGAVDAEHGLYLPLEAARRLGDGERG